jgi:putative Holliday junction resolvase
MRITHSSILSLDVGTKRIGVAVASLSARLARPLTTLTNDDAFYDSLASIIAQELVGALVVGYPRGLQGQSTAQTATIEAFAESLKSQYDMPVYFQDEALTSHMAEKELELRGKPYMKGDVDALAATYILEDFLNEHANLQEQYS